MRQAVSAIVASLLLGHVPQFFEAEWYMAMYCQGMQVAILSALVYQLVPGKETMLKSLCLVYVIYSALEPQWYFLYAFLDYNVYSWSYVLFTVLVSFPILKTLLKKYKLKSDKIVENNVYLCFWTPNHGLPLLSSILGYPFGGMAIYCDGHLYGYRWNNDKYKKEKISSKAIEKSFVVYNTRIRSNVIFTRSLNRLVGIDAGKLRTSCISTAIPFLKLLGPRFTPSLNELIPSVYYKKVVS